MCFSAEASFGAGMLLTITGIATIKKARTRSQLAFCGIPIIFGMQQFTEGFVWLGFENELFLQWKQLSIYIFLIMAQVVWPFWVPFSVLLLEKEKQKKRKLTFLLGIGSILAIYHTYCLITHQVYSEIRGHHIYYELDFPPIGRELEGTIYIIPTIFSPFISSIKGMKALGILIFASFIISILFFNDYVISVWCFLASLISVVVYSIISQQEYRTSENTILTIKKDL